MSILIRNNFTLEWDGDIGIGNFTIKSPSKYTILIFEHIEKTYEFVSLIDASPIERDMYMMHDVKRYEDLENCSSRAFIEYLKTMKEAANHINVKLYTLKNGK